MHATNGRSEQVPKPMVSFMSIQRCRILLAEDCLLDQRLTSHALKKAGAEVTIVENGQLAVDAALHAADESQSFDVILMDMQMPLMDGYTATSMLRAQGYREPIVALTGNSLLGDRERCLAAGCNDYACKPIDRVKLIELLSSLYTVSIEPTAVVE